MSVPDILKRAWRVNYVPGAQPRVCLDPGGAYGEVLATVAGFQGHPDTETVARALAAVPELIGALTACSDALDMIDGGETPECQELLALINGALFNAGALS